MLERDFGPSDGIGAIRPIGKIDRARGDLSGEAEQILRGGAIRLDAPGEFAGERVGDLIDIRADRAAKRFAVAGVIVDAADDPANDACFFAAMQGGIDGGTGAQIGEISWGEDPPPTVAVDSTKYPAINLLGGC